jgi:hypothetical protein
LERVRRQNTRRVPVLERGLKRGHAAWVRPAAASLAADAGSRAVAGGTLQLTFAARVLPAPASPLDRRIVAWG